MKDTNNDLDRLSEIITSYYSYFISNTNDHPKKYNYKVGSYLNDQLRIIKTQLEYIKYNYIIKDKVTTHLTSIFIHRKQPTFLNLKEALYHARNDIVDLENWKELFTNEINILAKHANNLSLELIYKLYLKDSIRWYTFLFVAKFVLYKELNKDNQNKITSLEIIQKSVKHLTKLFKLLEPIFKDDKEFIQNTIDDIKQSILLRKF